MKPHKQPSSNHQPDIHDQALQLAIDELVELCRHTRHGEVHCRVKLGLHGEVTDFEVRAGELDLDRIMAEPPHRVIEHDKLRRRGDPPVPVHDSQKRLGGR